MPKRHNTKRGRYNISTRRLASKKIDSLIEKRIDEISKKNDMKNDVIHTYDKFYIADGQDWTSVTELPTIGQFRPIAAGSLENKILTDFGGLVHDPIPTELAADLQDCVTVGLKGIQCRFGIQNRSTQSARVTVQLVYVPNLNRATADSVDYLRPDVFMLWKYGTGNILFDGWSKNNVKNMSSSQGGSTTYSILARQTFNLNGTTTTTNPNYTIKTKRVNLTKIWKNYKNHNIKILPGQAVAQPFTDGNYYFTIHSDLPVAGLYYIMASTVKFHFEGTTFEIGS